MQEVTGSTPVFSTNPNSYMSVLKQIAEYLYLRPKDPNRPKDKWIGYMHGINRISLFVFIICLIILAIKLIF